MPLLALRLPVEVAAPLAVLVSVTIAALALVQDFRQVQLRSAGWLVLATLAGIPLGLWVLAAADARLVKAALGLTIVAFALYALLGRAPGHLASDRISWLLGCGLCAGVLGGAYGMNGPPLVVYGSLRRWSPVQFRATLQAYFLPASALGMLGYGVAGLWTAQVTHLFLLALPGVLVATLAGRLINRRLSGATFLRFVYFGLMATGLALLAQSLPRT